LRLQKGKNGHLATGPHPLTVAVKLIIMNIRNAATVEAIEEKLDLELHVTARLGHRCAKI
jgi:hypothetical protein